MNSSSCREVRSIALAQRRRSTVLLFEPAGTLNTGNIHDARTVEQPPAL